MVRSATPVRRAQQLGRYHLLDRIAFGGMAEIYRAKTFDANGTPHLVAVKRVLAHLAEDDDFIQMLVDEAKIASVLRHQQHRARLRVRARARRVLHRDGACRRQGHAHRARALPREEEADPARARRVHRGRGRRRAARRALRGRLARPAAAHHPPRRLAVEHHLQLRRRGEAVRLRHREGDAVARARRRPASSRARSST